MDNNAEKNNQTEDVFRSVNLPPEKKSGGLKTRTLTALGIGAVYVIVLMLTILLNWRFVYDGFVILVTTFVAMEAARAFSNKYPTPMRAFILSNIVLGYGAFYVTHFWLSPDRSGGITAYFSILVLMLLGCIVFNMFSNRSSINNVLTTMLVLVYPTTICVYMLSLNYLPSAGYGSAVSNSAILMLVLLPAFSDTCAYFMGTLLKGPKLVPHISPKKTISGAVGGGIGGMLAGAIVLMLSVYDSSLVVKLSENMGWNIAHYLIIGVLGSMFVLVGDLIASYIKRQCGVKDFGKILPGHGGLLDRFDSTILAAVFLYVYYLILFYSSSI